MARLLDVEVAARPLDRFAPLLGQQRLQEVRQAVEDARRIMEGRVFWHVNSTARGGGVAEILQWLLPYVRGAGIDTRWRVISGSPAFFRVTKRLHHALHGATGDGTALGEQERSVYEEVTDANAAELAAMVRPRDVVLLHDPQTAGMAPRLRAAGAIVAWRCHIGRDYPNGEAARGWQFLAPYLEHVAATVFSRGTYVPKEWDRDRTVVIRPSIDPFSAKNQDMDDATVRAILVRAGIVEGPGDGGAPIFQREDGSPGSVQRGAEIVRSGPPARWDAPLVVQVSRWDPLKDPVGVMNGFVQANGAVPADAELVLAGPGDGSVADDPESDAVFGEVIAAWERLPIEARRRVHIVMLPMADIEENAAIVNALQRHASVIVQKSLDEGFGLTVTEAMWKGRPIIASAVGGIQDQIEDGVHGLLLEDPTRLDALGGLLGSLFADQARAEQLGSEARKRVLLEYLGMRHLEQYARLLAQLDEWSAAEPAS